MRRGNKKNSTQHTIIKIINGLDLIKLSMVWLLEFSCITTANILIVRCVVMIFNSNLIDAAVSIAASLILIVLCLLLEKYLSGVKQTGGG